MLLQAIELENFRQFLNEKVDFSTDENKNVTLIIGDNGTGKTTFAQAFMWCLYGETDFNDKILVNKAMAEKMTPDETVTVRVKLKLIHGSALYEIDRKQDYKKSYSNKVSASNSVLNVSIRGEDGNTRFLKALECETEIKRILPKELSKYFFFDGERIEKMSKEIATGKKSGSFKEAVTGLTGLQATQTALEHLSPRRSTSVMGRINEGYKGTSSEELIKLSKDIEEYQNRIDQIKARLDEIDDEIDAANRSKNQFEEDIKQYAEAEELQKQREGLNRDLAALQKMKSSSIKNACVQFNSGATQFFAASLVNDALKVVANAKLTDKSIPEMHSKSIEFLLNRGLCICGTHLDKGTVPYENVHGLLEYLPPQSIGVMVQQFIKDTKVMYSDEIELHSQIEEQLQMISGNEDRIDELRGEIGLIEGKLSGEDVSTKVRTLNDQIRTCEKTLSDRSAEQAQLYKEQGSLETQQKNDEARRSQLTLLDKQNRQIEILRAYAQRIYDELHSEYTEKEKATRDELEKSMNELFKSIYNGGLSLSIDDNYNISVHVEDVSGVETSTAQSISVIFAFITAIIKMARKNHELNQNDSYSEPYPLVMDAPLSAFDKRRIEAICKAIPETAEQVIIFIKDTDGELAEEHLGNKVNARHTFNKIDEFHTQLV